MARKAKFPRVEACKNLVEIWHLRSKLSWKSPEYFALMIRWEALCWEESYRLQSNKSASCELEARAWHNFYQKCPSGSWVERHAEMVWQLLLPQDPDLEGYRKRLLTESL